MSYTLRPYQQEAVNRTLAFFKKRRSPAVIVLPTGSGKSIVIAELARIAKGRVLVLAHVKELVEQNHQKYHSFGLEAGIYSAGLNKKDFHQKVIFGSIQSVARAESSFFENFGLVIIDECHRINDEGGTQYSQVIEQLKAKNPHICVLGLTATPYRLGLGWIYQHHYLGETKSESPRFFSHCIFELTLESMIKGGHLTRPIKIDLPVTSYDFSELSESNKMYSLRDVENLLKKQKRLTPLIVKNIIDITETYDRKGVMIFSSTINHAEEIVAVLPKDQVEIVIGDTPGPEREDIVARFKRKEFKYLVNVSVLTTGFDAPHVDLIAIMRPTESAGLYQQIIGRGLRPSPGKNDCLILDYTGMGHDIYSPEVGEKRPNRESVVVLIPCPKCGHENTFWGLTDEDGNIIEHYGRKCRGAIFDQETLESVPCGYRYRYKLCPSCGEENDITARECHACHEVLVDADAALKHARLSKNAHVFKADQFDFEVRQDRHGGEFLQVTYFDYDSNKLTEIHYLNNTTSQKKFQINFLRSHLRRPEINTPVREARDILKIRPKLRLPTFIIARKQGKFWKITEKIFSEELS